MPENRDWLLNRALLFTAGFFRDSCHNHGKPVYLHSLRIAHKLHDLGYSDGVIVAAILHDLIEDTDCTKEDIAQEFGHEAAELVACLSFNRAIPDRLERSRLSIDACAQYGKDALIIKCADAADNSRFFPLASPEVQSYLKGKHRYLLEVCQRHIPDEPAYAFYRDAVKEYL